MQVGTTKDQGLYNKPSAAVHPGALAARTLPQYNTMERWWNDTDRGTSKYEYKTRSQTPLYLPKIQRGVT